MSQRRFSPVSYDSFTEYLKKEKKTLLRQITNAQVHHTARPTMNGYRLAKDKESIIHAMYLYHTTPAPKGRGWRDIAQHFTFTEDCIWDGRPLNWDSGGFLGAENKGGICVEILVNSDTEQIPAEFWRRICQGYASFREVWPNIEFRLHRDQPSAIKDKKSCPGKGITLAALEQGVALSLAQQPSKTPEHTIERVNIALTTAGLPPLAPLYWAEKSYMESNIYALLKRFEDYTRAVRK